MKSLPSGLRLPGSALAATALATLALPAGALAAAAPVHGVVLSVDRAHHQVQVIDSHHRVHAYHYQGKLGKVHPGSRLTFKLKGTTISSLSVQAGSHAVSFYGRVVRSSTRGLVVRLADGKQVTFSARQVRKARKATPASPRGEVIAHMAASPTVTLNIQGLQPGVTVLVSETVDGSGNVTITITLPPPSVPGVTATQTSTGVVADVETDSLLVRTGDGSTLRLHMAQDALAAAGLSDCDIVSVTYHQDENLLIADGVQRTGTSTTGRCAPDQGDDGGDSNDDHGGDDGQVGGAITAVSSSALTIATTDGSMTFTVSSPAVTAGFQSGDLVEVSYGHAGADTLTATDVEYDEQEANGTVTAVSAGSLTLTDDDGHSDTFVGDPGQGVFSGVSVGDEVVVTSHGSEADQVADVVFDASALAGDLGHGSDGSDGPR